ncbi:MAG: hypothetical protein WC554_13570 [Clostridia bacterium]
MIVTGNLLYYDIKNKNGRIYSKETAENIVKQFGKLDHCIYGQVGFPEDEILNYKNISHKVNDMRINKENKSIEIVFETLKTPKGKILEENIQAIGGIKNFNNFFAIRTCGTGNINENGVIENYKLFSCNVIAKDTDAFIEKTDIIK